MKAPAYEAMKKGEVTAYLSLVFILLMTFVGGIMESASIQMAKNYRRADMNRAMESVFAEYQKELLEEYEIFALDTGYETSQYGEDMVIRRLEYYGAQNMEHQVRRIQYLTDHGGRAFYEQVAAYMEQQYGIDLVKEQVGMTDIWKKQDEQIIEYEQTGKTEQEHLEQLLEEQAGELPSEDNPIAYVEELKKSPILSLVMPEDQQVSEKKIALASVVSKRQRNQGYGDFSDVTPEAGTVDHLLFGRYLTDHFGHAVSEKDKGALDYELEYLLAGKESDRENLEAVVNQLLLFRFVPNYMHLQGSSTKKAEAEAMALTLCSLLAVPAITQAAAQVILLAWAYGECLMDVRALLNKGKVPLMKNEESWQLSLSDLLKLGQDKSLNDGQDTGSGLTYEEYLRILLFLEKKEALGMRALDLIENNLRTKHGLTSFRADQCVSKMEMDSTCKLRRGIHYRFSTYFGYN